MKRPETAFHIYTRTLFPGTWNMILRLDGLSLCCRKMARNR
jgi:hypothetical protein